jgi:hypothetical protein
MISRDLLLKHGVIADVFEYDFLEDDISTVYSYFENRFIELFKWKVEIFNLKDWHFYIKNGFGFNAFARTYKGYNIIGITNGYVVHTSKIFNENHFKYMSLAGLKGYKELSEEFAYLEENPNFQFGSYMRNCAIEFTLGHEFQHILQFNSSNIKLSHELHENPDESQFSMQRHVWEFDADRFGSFDVLKYAFEVYRRLNCKNVEVLKCLIYLGVSSVVITRILFYLNAFNANQAINVQEFYTKEFSHPHPFVRIFNILEFSIESANDMIHSINIGTQEMLNLTLEISYIFFKSFLPDQDPLKNFFEMLDVERINEYNNELYEHAVKDEVIRSLLTTRGIHFED